MRIDQWRQNRSHSVPKIDPAKVRSRIDERANDVIVFLRFAGTCRVHECSARTNIVRGANEQGELIARQPRQFVFAPSPPDVRIPANRPKPRAWRVHEHAIEMRFEGERP